MHDEMQTVLVNIPFADLEALVDSAIQMEGKLHQANENRKRRMMNQSGPHHTRSNNSSGGFTPRNNRPPAQTYRPNYANNNGGPPKPGGNTNNNNHNSNNNNGNNTNTNTGPRTGSNTIPVTPKDKSTVNCYECGVVGHYSNECPKKLAKIAANTAAQQRRFAVPSPSSLDHAIGQASRAQTRQKRARHAVSAPRRRPGRARARHRTAASALPYLSISASRTLTPPATHQTSSLACGGPVDVAMIKVLPPRYCTHLIIACTPPSTIRCAVALNSSA
ncbi:hypothetical protein QYE76_054414 [Lolium multiflorum]|uniref:CCHC-type domain-containing protein n=1 Tax=Lolium multiflorum TaxID=4521 RepID=A0AAD8SZ21_LOLMU|nr:hypothetical protein QYE76_054414 [Lolium multiflorum]